MESSGNFKEDERFKGGEIVWELWGEGGQAKPLKKMNDSKAERLFGNFGVRAAKRSPKKKSLDALIRRLQDAS
ncbi:hypothetical protein AMTR_s00022p00113340 [Amborella trichopoda]|uniref:Uncharacterized protein n=1 Tax=Amborella trichopoda TaxID=13333 RepID=W1PN92_AMBTC|nr:hypothetical protein AMTR_s00022p00113340 [Amborella trichopoda]